MNGKQAKKLRKKLYKEQDYRERSEYVTTDNPNTVISDSLRRKYQLAKKKGGK